MLLDTPGFLALLVVVVALFYALPRARLWVLFAADLVFYGLPNPAHLVLFLGVSLMTFVCARRGSHLLLALAIAVNAANLIFFKYALFLTRAVESALGIPLPAAGSFLVEVALPIGISFYTFGLIAYLVDVWRGQLVPVRSFARFWVFVSLFPRLVAGPIARGRDLVPQVEAVTAYRFSADDFRRGLTLLLVGLAKKIVVADTLKPYVDHLFAQAAGAAGAAVAGGVVAGAAVAGEVALGGGAAWMAAYLFAFQIYLDFSAYSDMAVGIGALLGFRLPQNFRTPYVSASPSEFWRRWHITLSTWIRDYVYIPLGGSRKGLGRQMVNLVLAMTFSGLWHGAGWTFVVWGLYHGVLAALEKSGRLLGARLRRRAGIRGAAEVAPAQTGSARAGTAWVAAAIARAVSVAVFFHLVVIGWVFFRAADLSTALAMVRAMLSPGGWSLGGLGLSGGAAAAASLWGPMLVLGLYALHLMEHVARRDSRLLDFWFSRVPPVVRGLAYAMVIILVMTFVQTGQNPFIYSRF